jgi:hypothetical protein
MKGRIDWISINDPEKPEKGEEVVAIKRCKDGSLYRCFAEYTPDEGFRCWLPNSDEYVDVSVVLWAHLWHGNKK